MLELQLYNQRTVRELNMAERNSVHLCPLTDGLWHGSPLPYHTLLLSKILKHTLLHLLPPLCGIHFTYLHSHINLSPHIAASINIYISYKTSFLWRRHLWPPVIVTVRKYLFLYLLTIYALSLFEPLSSIQIE